MNSLYARRVMSGGIISIKDVLYQVPLNLEGQEIIVDPERLEYRPTSIVRHEDPIPEFITLQPGLLTAREINDRRAAREVLEAATVPPADHKAPDRDPE
ncbi:hypothetical protein GSbR_19370 [Geobacter sp. SVR]|nr:hypothetical protein GSVR_34640 [Geobacter sp. SVR]GCF85337.1 hypothetical protein GSbR_19370 [Geobacter sp. SVR]